MAVFLGKNFRHGRLIAFSYFGKTLASALGLVFAFAALY